MHKDISLTGGTSVTINGEFDAEELEQALSGKLEELNTREIYDLITREKLAIVVGTTSDGEQTEQILEEYVLRALATAVQPCSLL